MTDDELKAIEHRLEPYGPARPVEVLDVVVVVVDERVVKDSAALIAEVRRLHGLIKQVEWAGLGATRWPEDRGCPWCDESESVGKHTPTCPAFGEAVTNPDGRCYATGPRFVYHKRCEREAGHDEPHRVDMAVWWP